MNPAVFFLVGGAALAAVLTAVVWLFSRPRRVVDDPNELRVNLRALRRDGPSVGGPVPSRPVPPSDQAGGIRVLGHEGIPVDGPETGDSDGPSAGEPSGGRWA